MHARQKRARLRTLYDAVIVCARNRNDFADAELRQSFGRHRVIFRRILDSARRDNHGLTGHQARRRSDCADGSGIRERKSCALKIRHAEFAVARSLDYIIISREEFVKAHVVRVLDVRNEQ
jgi:hypothetical protein